MKKLILLLLIAVMAFAMFYKTPTRPTVNSSSLEKVVTEDGNVTRTDYVDENGHLTYASNLRYATLIKTKDGDTVLEEYFDENGERAKQSSGHYALKREYKDGKEVRTTWLNADLQPTLNTSHYSIRLRTYNDEGKVETEKYCDVNGNPIANSSGVYGRKNEYENGLNTTIIYTDTDGKPLNNKSGYAIACRTFNEDGKVETEFYFDANDQQVSLSLGQYGVRNGYNEQGKKDKITYLGADGEPITTNRGYTSLSRSYTADGVLESDMYLGLNDEPVALARGQYGVRYVDGKKVYLDAEGNDLFDLSQFLHNEPRAVILIGVLVIIASLLLPRKWNYALLAAYVGFIIYMTLMYRYEGESRAAAIFWSYKQFFSSPGLRAEILNNIWLFVPFGVILYRIWPRPVVLLIPILFSVLIEVIQYFTGLGLAEVDDVISNGLGGLIGVVIGWSCVPKKQ